MFVNIARIAIICIITYAQTLVYSGIMPTLMIILVNFVILSAMSAMVPPLFAKDVTLLIS
jgi:hypothetical protein